MALGSGDGAGSGSDGHEGVVVPSAAVDRLERALAEQDATRYVLRLYVTGATQRSLAAIASVRRMCEKHLHGRYDLEVVDLYRDPGLGRTEQILAVPTLIRKAPLPSRRLIGDMTNEDRVLAGLNLQQAE